MHAVLHDFKARLLEHYRVQQSRLHSTALHGHSAGLTGAAGLGVASAAGLLSPNSASVYGQSILGQNQLFNHLVQAKQQQQAAAAAAAVAAATPTTDASASTVTPASGEPRKRTSPLDLTLNNSKSPTRTEAEIEKTSSDSETALRHEHSRLSG